MTPVAHHEDDGVAVLLDRTGAPTTARPLWWSAWSRAWGRPEELVELRRPAGVSSSQGRPDELLGVAPLATRRRAGGTEVMVLGGDSADHARLPAASDGDARALADLVAERLQELPGRWHLRLAHLPPADPVAQRLAEVLPGARWCLAADRASPWVRLRRASGVEDYLSANWRRARKRRQRDWERSEGQVRHVRDPEELAALLPRLARVRRGRDHAAGRASDIDSPRGRAFWSSIILEHAAAGEAEVALAEVGDELVGYNVVLLDGPAHRLWDGRVAAGAERLGAGLLLQEAALQRALDAGRAELDLLRGVTPAKLHLATDVRACSVLEAWSTPWARTGELALRGAGDWARTTRDSSPRGSRAWLALKNATVVARAARGTEGEVW